MGKFLGWLGGIFAAVIGGWLVWYLTKPPATTTFEGMVINGAANQPVPKAMVSVEITGPAGKGLYHDVTDDNGSYKLDFTGLGKASGVRIEVAAGGFQALAPVTLSSVTDDNRQDFILMPQAPSPPTGLTGGRGGQSPAATHLPAYIQKSAARAARIAIQPGR
ncbi:MAG TPA: hypothetical protein VLY23_03430 [Candidatus Acidoferrum sp.]|nr:hypothetical protein [Candidatus Acidoferrum sp.]